MDKRLFIAVKYNPNKEILNLIIALKGEFEDEKIKFVDPDNIHLTLKFLGDTNEILIDDITDELKNISCNYRTMSLIVTEAGSFYKKTIPFVVFLKTSHEERLINLAKDIDRSLEKFGIANERRKFKPHLTLARIKYLKKIKKFENYIENLRIKEHELTIDSFELIESKLYPTGSVYETVETFYFPI